MKKVQVSTRNISKNEDIPCENYVNPTFVNLGTAPLKVLGRELSTGDEYGIDTSGLPMANKTLAIRFGSTGNKLAHITWGKIVCTEDNH